MCGEPDLVCSAFARFLFNGCKQNPANPLALEGRVNGDVGELRAVFLNGEDGTAGNAAIEFCNKDNLVLDVVVDTGRDIGQVGQPFFYRCIGAVDAVFQ